MRNYLGSFALAVAATALSGCGGSGDGAGCFGECTSDLGQALATTNDLTVAYVQRLPILSWVEGSTNPTRDGWPSVGQSVTWRGVVRNFSSSARSNVQYRWFWDGAQVAQGTFSVAANASVNVDLARTWDFDRHSVRLVIDTANTVSEEEEQNNELTVVSNAVNLGLWVEQGVYDYFLAHQRELAGARSTCWENWAQRQVTRWNDVLFANAAVLDRIRLDKIVIVPNGALPLAGGQPTNHPDLADHTVDLQWGFPRSLLDGDLYVNTTSATLQNAFFYEESLIHELGHARYLVDNYGFNVHQDPSGLGRDGIPHLEGGASIVGTPFLPMVTADTVYATHQHGLMNTERDFVDEYSVFALNRIAGARAVAGNANAPGNFGAYLNDLPTQNQITLVDAANNAPLASANVRIYQSQGNGQLYGKNFSPTPSQTLTSDAAGRISVGRNPFSAGELSPWHENTDVLLRVEHQSRVRYLFLEASDFNLEYFRGHTSLGAYTLPVAFLAGGVVNGNPILGFESASYWTASSGALASVTSPVTQGAAALRVSNIAYATLTSAALSSQSVSVGSQLKFDLLLPQLQPQSWHGQVSVFVTAPSRNLYNAPIGTVELTGLPLETYNTITMAVPAWIRTALTSAPFNDLSVKIALNVASGSGRHLIDAFRFLP
ncbi:MAG TPA: CARDB domain-containing protein [Polyangiaceae bacterium]